MAELCCDERPCTKFTLQIAVQHRPSSNLLPSAGGGDGNKGLKKSKSKSVIYWASFCSLTLFSMASVARNVALGATVMAIQKQKQLHRELVLRN